MGLISTIQSTLLNNHFYYIFDTISKDCWGFFTEEICLEKLVENLMHLIGAADVVPVGVFYCLCLRPWSALSLPPGSHSWSRPETAPSDRHQDPDHGRHDGLVVDPGGLVLDPGLNLIVDPDHSPNGCNSCLKNRQGVVFNLLDMVIC